MLLKMNPAFSIFYFSIDLTGNIFLKQAVIEIHYLEELSIAKKIVQQMIINENYASIDSSQKFNEDI